MMKKKPHKARSTKKTQQTEQRGISHTERKASKQIPCSSCCSLPSLSHTSQKPRTTAVGELALPPFLRAPRWRKESSNPAQIPPLRARFWPREPRILDRIDCWSIYSSRMVRLAHNKPAATGIKSPSFLPVSESVSSAPKSSSSPCNGEERVPRLDWRLCSSTG